MPTPLPHRCPSCDATLPESASGGPCPSCGSTQPNTGRQNADTIDLDDTPETVSIGADFDPDGDGHASQASSPHDNRLQLLGEIAHGGMGAVLRGRDDRLRREIAVKVLLDQHRDNPVMLRRFIEEAQICGQLQHPGIVPVYESGTLDDRRPYFAMKLVKGRTLAALLADRADPTEDLPRFLGIFEQICQAVAYAHARGVIHRDLKPANVMVGGFGEVQVMDWGLAKVLNRDDAKDEDTPESDETSVSTARSDTADSDYSRAGSALGTPSYMAPEQARGENDSIDERADVFALGSILCVILTGQPAFTGRSSVEIHGKATRAETADAVARLDACAAGAELTTLAKDCLAAEPADRPRDAGIVRDRISAYLVGVQERLRTAEVERARAEVRAAAERTRRRLQLGLAAAVLAITTIGGLGFTYELYRRQSREARLSLALNEATLVRDQAREAIDDPARWRAAAEALRGVALALGDADSPAARARLESLQNEVQNGLAAAERDAELLEALLDARANGQEVGFAGTDAAYKAAFADAGIDLDPAHLAETTNKLRAHRPERVVELASYLDHWAAIGILSRKPREKWLLPLNLARAIDRDADRDRLRALIASEDPRAQTPALEALAKSVKVAEWPAPTVLLLSNGLRLPQRLALLEQAAVRYPDDVWIHFVLAGALETNGPMRLEDALRHYTAARALNPSIAVLMADLLDRMNRADEAEVVHRDLNRRQPNNVKRLLSLALFLKKNHRHASETAALFDRAITLGRAAVRKSPNDFNAHVDLGVALRNTGDFPGAIAEYREAIRLQPSDYMVHFSLGNALVDAGDASGAIAEYHETLRLNPGYPDAHLSRGIALMKLGDLPGAMAALHEAIRIKPDYPEAYTNLGVALSRSGDLPGALTAYREAVRLKPDLPEAYTGLCSVLTDLGDLPGALAACREAIRLVPGSSLAHANLGSVLVLSGDVPGGLAASREAIRIDPDLPEASVSLGGALTSMGDLPGAIAAYRKAIRLKPDLPEAHAGLGAALLLSGDVPGAIAANREAIRLKPTYTDTHNNLGTALFQSGDLPGAIAAYREAIRLKPNDPKPHMNLGRTLIRFGDLPGAIAEYREAIRLKPDDPEAHSGLGDTLLASVDVPGALAEYREAVRLRPEFALAHCNLGFTLRQRGDYAESLAEYRIGHELGSKQPGWEHPSAQWVAQAERLVQLSQRLQAVLRGEAQPTDNAERLGLFEICLQNRHYATATRLWAEALEADPKLAEAPRDHYLYNASCTALLAAAGKGQGEPTPDDNDKLALRQQALGWLKVALAAWAKLLDTDALNARGEIVRTLQHWREDPDLAAIRDQQAMEALPEAERADWRAFWNDVAQLREKAQSKP